MIILWRLLEIRYLKMGIVRHRKLGHVGAVCHTGVHLTGLVGRIAIWHNQHIVQGKGFVGRFGQNQMSGMNRIEGSTKNTDLFSRRLHDNNRLSMYTVSENYL